MLEALEDMADGPSEFCIKASGILHKFQKSNTFLGLIITLEAVEPLEILNTVLQARYKTVSGMKRAVASVKRLIDKRSEEEFRSILVKANEKVSELDLEEISTPRQRHVSNRYTGPAASFQPSTAEKFYSLEYFSK